jgi:7,8-dihydropterin-6-yl-methyl-4-(beta-D-ribofuranosyl)aminobenzene 5'-phosphate synthase
MKLILISDGSTKWQRFIKRWGISYLLGDDVIFDTFGRADVFWGNIRKFRIDIKRIKHVVISHDDWDHIAGLTPLLNHNCDVSVYVCKNSSQTLKEKIHRFRSCLTEIDQPIPITESVYSSGEMTANTKRGVLFEQSLVVKTGKGISVITGCAHPGITEIVKRASEQFKKEIHAVIGGFHMKDNNSSENEKIIKDLWSMGVRVIMPSHCTGKDAVALIKKRYGNACIQLRENESVEI